MLKMLIIIIFIAYSNPISSHALARAHYKRRHFPLILSDDKEQMDAYREIVPNENREDQL
jgi:multisubunit Na+/H+ antiporter MnhG subunit